MKSKNKFLDGNWHPVEETSAENLKVSGEIPKELARLFLRNGPNPKKFDEIDTKLKDNVDYVVNLRKTEIMEKPSSIIKIFDDGKIEKIR